MVRVLRNRVTGSDFVCAALSCCTSSLSSYHSAATMSASASTSSARTDASMNHYLSSSNCSLHIERGVLAAALAVLVCAICSQQCAHALPAPAPAYDFLIKMSTEPASMFSENNECHSSSDVETLCQRCAKATKSNVVYPMCCENKEEAREWCDRYLHFGIQ